MKNNIGYPFVKFPFCKMIGEGVSKGMFYRQVCFFWERGQSMIAPIGLHLIYRFYLYLAYSFLHNSKYVMVSWKKLNSEYKRKDGD